MPVPDTFRTQNELLDYLTLLEDRIARLEAQVVEMNTSFDVEKKQLETQLEMGAKEQTIEQVVEEALPHTGLISHSFLARAFSVWGHFLVSTLILAVIIALVYYVVVYLVMPYFPGLHLPILR